MSNSQVSSSKTSSKKWLPTALAVVLGVAGLTPVYFAYAAKNKTANGEVSASDFVPTEADQKAAYSIGYFMGKDASSQLPELNADELTKGFGDVYAGKKSKYSDEEIKAIMQVLQQKQGKGLTEVEGRKLGYSLGYLMATDNKNVLPQMDVAAFNEGFKGGFAQSPSKYPEAEMGKAITELKKKTEAEVAQKAAALGAKAEQEGADYLAANGKKTGVKTTSSGLQYETLKEGTGAAPKAADTVKVHYEGKLINGTVFDTSYGKDPISFPLAGVIPGWTEGLQLMKEGGKTRFVIPAQLAYGPSGAGSIPPNSTLIFEVELIKVNP